MSACLSPDGCTVTLGAVLSITAQRGNEAVKPSHHLVVSKYTVCYCKLYCLTLPMVPIIGDIVVYCVFFLCVHIICVEY